MPETQSAEALARILALAKTGTRAEGHIHHPAGEEGLAPVNEPGCTVRQLPDRLSAAGAGVAVAVNPVNAPQRITEIALAVPDDPLALTLTIGKYFGPAPRVLTVSFLETTPSALRNRIIQHLNAWNAHCGISFRYTSGTGKVRISRAGAGYWSYLGTDIFLIPKNRPTMNLQGFSMATPESEYKRVVRHEAGHTLGFPHEHMRKELVDRIDKQKAYAYFLATQGWNQAMVDAQVLTALNQASIMGTPADQTSIMCYHLPGAITKNGQPIAGGSDINPTDAGFAARVYPKPTSFMADEAPQQEAVEGVDAGVDGGDEGAEEMPERAGGAYLNLPRDWSDKDDVDVADAIAEARAL